MVLALVLSLSALATAASYTYTADNRISTVNNNGKLQISGLNAGTTHNLQRSTGSNYVNITSFTADSNGNAVLNYNVNQSKTFEVNEAGYIHRISNSGFSEEFEIDAGLKYNYFNSYADNTINTSLYDFTDGSGGYSVLEETSGKLRMTASGSDYSYLLFREDIKTGETATLNATVDTTNGFASGNIAVYGENRNFDNDLTALDTGVGTQWTVYKVRNTENEVQVLDKDGNVINSVSKSLDDVYVQFEVFSGSNNQNNVGRIEDISYTPTRVSKNINKPLKFSTEGSYDWTGYTDTNDRNAGINFKNENTGYTVDINSLGTSNNVEITNTENVSDDTVVAYGDYMGQPPSIDSVNINPRPISYGSTVDLEAVTSDNDSSVSSLDYELRLDGDVYSEGSLDKSGTNNWDLSNAFTVNDAGNYVLELTATDTDGNTDTYTESFTIEPFQTQFDFDELGVWSDEAITPNLNRTGFKMSWSDYNSNEVNYTYGTLDVYIVSLDRNRTVYLSQPKRWDFRNNSIDHPNGSINYFLDFTRLTDYEVTNRILGDDMRIERRFNFRNDSGDVVRSIYLTDTHQSVEKQGGFFNAIWESVGALLPDFGVLDSMSDFLGDILDGIINLPSNLADAIGDGIDFVAEGTFDVIEGVIESIDGVINAVWRTLADLTAAVINGLSYVVGWIFSLGNLLYFQVADYALEVPAELDKNNESFTYYNYTGNYSTRLNETSATFLESVFREYSLNVSYSAGEYLNNKNIAANNLSENEVYVLYNTTTINGSQRNATINTYSLKPELPDGVSAVTIGGNTVISAVGSFFRIVFNLVPDQILVAVETFFNLGAVIFGTLYRFAGAMADALNFIFGKGWNYTVLGLQLFVGFKALHYGKTLMEGVKGDRDLHNCVNEVIKDLEDQYDRANTFVYQTFRLSEKAISFALDVIKTVASWIPFL